MKRTVLTIIIVLMVIGGIVLIPGLSSGGQTPPPNDGVDGLQYIDGDWTVSGYENYSNEIIR